VSINYGFDADATVNIDVYDTSGRRVRSLENNKTVYEGELNTSTFSVSDLNAGLYIITIISSNGNSETHRLMIGNR
ncbi:MAG: T9SS type A sorting domain-containing protein, partial [Flavobacteriales bacterium]|nr:T9SS type A sorting domain-containing protein [Flavobacteriales bacterium]